MTASRAPAQAAAADDPRLVRHLIATAMLGTAPSAMLGSVTLMPHQLDAVSRLRDTLRTHHVALLADDVGLGKTFVALAIARDYPRVRIIAPAALLPMWRSALARAECHHASLASLQQYSRSSANESLDAQSSPSSTTGSAESQLVVIDEAHHLRNTATNRYGAVAREVTGHDVLLLSATPIHNAPRDLRALLSLVLGEQADALHEELLAAVIVRRTQSVQRPRVDTRPPLRMPHDPAVLNAILALPAPLPARDGAVAGALIKLGLLRAWCSSDAALTQSLTRRLLRGEALKQSLLAGRHPTSSELRSWLVGEHEVQLAFPELLASQTAESGALLDVLMRHLDAVDALRTLHRTGSNHDVARANALRAILHAHPDVPVVAFSQFSATVRAVGRALADIAGVGVLTGDRATIASGDISRQEALEAFAPLSNSRPPPPAHRRIRLLLTTDILAEGVNLQDAGVIVHLDLPWTDALRQQRVGRCVRVGSLHAQVSVYQIDPPTGADSVLRLLHRLERKARWMQRYVGDARADAPAARRATRPIHVSAADAATLVRERLHQWRDSTCAADADAVAGVSSPSPRRSPRAAICSTHRGFIAVVHSSLGSTTLLVGRVITVANGRSRLRVSAHPRWQLIAMADAGSPRAATVNIEAWREVRRALRRWIARHGVQGEIGDRESDAGRPHALARASLAHAVNRASTATRVAHRADWRDALRMIRQVRGAAAEAALNAWVKSRPTMPLDVWLVHWRRWPALQTRAPAHETSSAPSTSPPRVAAVLLLQGPATPC